MKHSSPYRGFQLLEPNLFPAYKVYWKSPHSNASPAVVLMHELTGMTDEVLDFADRLVNAGLTVYLPLLFGKIGQQSAGLHGTLSTLRFTARICISAEFNALKAGASSPITKKLRQLCQVIYQIKQHQSYSGLGAVGLCMSGGFALSLLLENHPNHSSENNNSCVPLVQAPVACHPALPSGKLSKDAESDLGISAQELVEVKRRVSQTQLLLVRFEEDQVSPQAREARYRAEFGDDLDACIISAEARCRDNIKAEPPEYPHSAMAGQFADENKVPYPSTEAASNRVIEFLQERLTQSEPAINECK